MDEDAKREQARTNLLRQLTAALTDALDAKLNNEAAVISALIHAILMGQSGALAMAIHRSKPGA